jgi:hypothetical protein
VTSAGGALSSVAIAQTGTIWRKKRGNALRKVRKRHDLG